MFRPGVSSYFFMRPVRVSLSLQALWLPQSDLSSKFYEKMAENIAAYSVQIVTQTFKTKRKKCSFAQFPELTENKAI